MNPIQENEPARERLSADVVVIGAGIAGGLMAYELARQKRKVLILEAGPDIDRTEAVRRFRSEPVKRANSPYEMAHYAPYPSDETPWTFYGQQGPKAGDSPRVQAPFQGLYIRGVGGASWHFTGHAERFQINDFRMKSVYGVGQDWPVSYAELEPFYHRAEAAWGVAGGPDTIAPPRSTPYPMPPVPISWLDRSIARAAEPLGWGVGGYPHARVSLPEGYDGRPQCCGNASCRFICPIGAKYDGSVHVHKAVQAGADLKHGRVVYNVEIGTDGRIKAVQYRLSDGGWGEARGKLFILAAHAIETPKLLLMSTNQRARGVANSSNLVGRNLMCNVDADTMGYAPQPVWPFRGPVSATGGVTGLRDGAFRSQRAAAATFIVNGGFDMTQGPMKEAMQALHEGTIGSALSERVRENTARQVHLSSSIEVLPDERNGVVPDLSRRDSLGIPLPQVDFRVDEYSIAGWKAAAERDRDILRNMGARDITSPLDCMGKDGPDNTQLTVDYAILGGTAVMGENPKTSVVNSYCQSHDHGNLFIVGTSAYPTISICSPSLTLAALALRATDHIVATSLA
ncbi:GMC family oxidoreductase [Azospirillum sp. SYSU D00513]|uniref:GMC family oxidoreductase n=1 Tax=Azospirillum sp. SYSU D00513 TaxID=2812561 RepID=UPI001A97B70A|nr:GMC family oxidoreductase [Azospirillum sp. SYSU D00513]